MKKNYKITPDFKRCLWERVEVLYDAHYGNLDRERSGMRLLVKGIVVAGLVLSVLIGEKQFKKQLFIYSTNKEMVDIEQELREITEIQYQHMKEGDNIEANLIALEKGL